jgi:hypothetical protein
METIIIQCFVVDCGRHHWDTLYTKSWCLRFLQVVRTRSLRGLRRVVCQFRCFRVCHDISRGMCFLSSQASMATQYISLQLITHQPPYSHIKHTTEVVIRASQGERPGRPTDPSVVERGLDDQIWSLLVQCWAIDSAERPTIPQVLLML